MLPEKRIDFGRNNLIDVSQRRMEDVMEEARKVEQIC